MREQGATDNTRRSVIKTYPFSNSRLLKIQKENQLSCKNIFKIIIVTIFRFVDYHSHDWVTG